MSQVSLATLANGTELAETRLQFCTRPSPPARLPHKWGYCMTEKGVMLRLIVSWSASAPTIASHIVEVEEGGQGGITTVAVATIEEDVYSYITNGW